MRMDVVVQNTLAERIGTLLRNFDERYAEVLPGTWLGQRRSVKAELVAKLIGGALSTVSYVLSATSKGARETSSDMADFKPEIDMALARFNDTVLALYEDWARAVWTRGYPEELAMIARYFVAADAS